MHFTTRLIFRVKKTKEASRSERLPCLQAVACCCNPLGVFIGMGWCIMIVLFTDVISRIATMFC